MEKLPEFLNKVTSFQELDDIRENSNQKVDEVVKRIADKEFIQVFQTMIDEYDFFQTLSFQLDKNGDPNFYKVMDEWT